MISSLSVNRTDETTSGTFVRIKSSMLLPLVGDLTIFVRKLSATRQHNESATTELDVGEMENQSILGTLKSPHKITGHFIDDREFKELDND